MKEGYIVELEPDVFIAPWEGDPGRTVKVDNADVFHSSTDAKTAIIRAQTYRPFKNACVYSVTKTYKRIIKQ